MPWYNPPRSCVGCPLDRGFVSLEGRTTLERDSASLGGWTPPLARGPASVKGRAPPRASFRLALGIHVPAASIPVLPVGAFNALIFAGAKSKANPRHCAPGNHALALLRNSRGAAIPATV
jgi:hypothetical protein